MAEITSTAAAEPASHRYANRGFVEAEYARCLLEVDEMLSFYVQGAQLVLKLLERARLELAHGTTTPETYRAISAAMAVFDDGEGPFGGVESASDLPFMADILRGAVIVDCNDGKGVDAGQPFVSAAARSKQRAAMLAEIDCDE